MKVDTILVFDFGGQYCHLIARRVRENQVYSEIVPYDTTTEEIVRLKEKFNIKGIILSGGPLKVYAESSPKLDKKILDLRIPILGICYGHQLIAYMVGGVVKPAEKREFGITYATLKDNTGIFEGLNENQKVWMSHSDSVFSLPQEYEVLAYTENTPVAAFRQNRERGN